MKEIITIIIPTHDRHHVLLRTVDYYSQINVSVVIADSSKKPFTVKLPNNFTYLHFPYSFMGNKIYKALGEVSTKYSCLCADDDFLSESGLREGLKFLEKNIDYASVQGNYIAFYASNPPDHYYSLYDNNTGYENSSVSIKTRLEDCYRVPQIYALHKTTVLKSCFEITVDISAITTVEMCIPLISLCFGKHKVLPVFWAARDVNRYTRYTRYTRDTGVDNNSCSVVVTDWNEYLQSEEGRRFKDNFISIAEDIVPEYIDPATLFDSAFNNYLSLISNKKTVSIQRKMKNIIRLFLPSTVVGVFQRINIKRRRLELRHEAAGYPWCDNQAASDWNIMKQSIDKLIIVDSNK
jgi:glycosyltransferase domain-containing protein